MKKVSKQCKIAEKTKRICTFLKVDGSFFVVLFFALLLDEFKFYAIYILFMILHELTHYFVSKKLGYSASKISVGVFGAKLEGDDDFVLEDEIKVVLAGPIFNLFIVVLCYLSFWFYPESYAFLNDVLTANLALLFFNSLPIYPLDLGRFLLAIFSQKMERQKAIKRVRKISVAIIAFLFVCYLASCFYEINFSLGFACVNMLSLSLSSSKDTSYKRQLFAKRKFEKLEKGLPEKNIYLPETISDYKLFKFIDDFHFVNFVFLNEDLKQVKKVSEIEFYKQNNLI